jgi:hypothetical protein
MVARTIKSVEQFKNVRLNEAAKILGINELPSKNKIPRLLHFFTHLRSDKLTHCLHSNFMVFGHF